MRKFFLFVILAALAAFAPSPASAQHQRNRWWMPQVHRGYGGYGSYGYPTWYSTGYNGYGGYGSYGYQCATGVKFHLDLIAKSDLKQVKRAIVSIDGNEFGTVNRFDGFWNGILPLPPGQHEVVIETLDDQRKFRTIVALNFGTVVSVYPRFRPENGSEVVAPAPTPSPAPRQTEPVKPQATPSPTGTATQLAAERENPRCQGPWPVPDWYHRAAAGCR